MCPAPFRCPQGQGRVQRRQEAAARQETDLLLQEHRQVVRHRAPQEVTLDVVPPDDGGVALCMPEGQRQEVEKSIPVCLDSKRQRSATERQSDRATEQGQWRRKLSVKRKNRGGCGRQSTDRDKDGPRRGNRVLGDEA